MIKKQTGRKIDAKDFKLLNQCVECGYATNIKYGSKCPLCELLDRPKCKLCEIVLRDVKITYAYDHNNKFRDIEKVKVSKKPIKEFLIHDTPVSKPYSEDMCEDCHEYIEGVKRILEYLKCSVCCKELLLSEDNMFDYLKERGEVCCSCHDILSGVYNEND